MKAQQYPRVITSAVIVGAFGDAREPLYRGELFRVTLGDDDRVRYIRIAECDHTHRQRRKAEECADRLAVRDGAPR